MAEKGTHHWLARLEQVGYWCSDVYDYDKLTQSEAYQALDMEQVITRSEGTPIRTTRCPIHINGETLTSNKPRRV
ncbi:probable racemase [Vibrio astriarenae]|nr:probable racemase [Vibrio sp. C7]